MFFLGSLAVLATISHGAQLGFRRQWGYMWWAILYGAVWLGIIVFFSSNSTVPANANNTPGGGIFAAFITFVLTPLVALFLWIGGYLGLMMRRRGDPHSSRR
jgi:hypothetical protein